MTGMTSSELTTAQLPFESLSRGITLEFCRNLASLFVQSIIILVILHANTGFTAHGFQVMTLLLLVLLLLFVMLLIQGHSFGAFSTCKRPGEPRHDVICTLLAQHGMQLPFPWMYAHL